MLFIKRTTCLLLMLPIFATISCGQEAALSTVNKISDTSSEHKIKSFEYQSLGIQDFFKALTKNHLNDFYLIDKAPYLKLCKANNLIAQDSLNIEKYFTIKILHDLFTSQTASNCSKGEILNIPYQCLGFLQTQDILYILKIQKNYLVKPILLQNLTNTILLQTLIGPLIYS